jgi:glycosyltransferase involved in cell wall biosynthesis
MNDEPSISVVIPCYNEQDNLRPLLEAVRKGLEPINLPYEIIFTDDGSQDNSWVVLKELGARDARVRGLRLERNCGQSAALWAGIHAARAPIVITLAADLQNDPSDIPKFLEAMKHADCVCGTRVESRRQGDNWVRRVSSRIANGVRNALSQESVSDAGCCFRAFRRECVDNLKFFKGMHRFLPTLFKIEGFTVTEIPIKHHPRHAGETHYGIGNRLFSGLYDLMAVRWMKNRMFRYDIAERVNLEKNPPKEHEGHATEHTEARKL